MSDIDRFSPDGIHAYLFKDSQVRSGLAKEMDYTGFDGPSSTSMTPHDGDVWIYDGTSQKWKPGKLSESVTLTADGTETVVALLNRLYATIDATKISVHSCIKYNEQFVFNLNRIQSTQIWYDRSGVTDGFDLEMLVLASSDSHYYKCTGSTPTFGNNDTFVPTSGTKITLYY